MRHFFLDFLSFFFLSFFDFFATAGLPSSQANAPFTHR
ncbi:hypothetical protein AMIS_22520 [Actinoplanes missouriensis 431]|uniref:Uncharacterized protein n=1 Tax=Actinoplanes missouriensis (strain ATCC 14538 / DSM 43046 / CBS 188.64 / JCM 3121 / NBRC 102363 / NCIMB 12654 / NRRL B-3342 / UNCC 431) TaxID=512565 RepID=I0H385_ACTM4|nr:hypothetical protein AMIS_22520 [Actinoplanes missouriensis 431]